MENENTGDNVSIENTDQNIIDSEASEINTAEELQEEMFEFVANGQTERVTKSELLKLAAHGKGAAQAMTKAAQEKKNALRLADLIKKDPFTAAKEILGQDFNEREFLTKKLAALMEEDMMTPEEKAHREQMAELESYRSEKKRAAQEKEDAEFAALVESTKGQLAEEMGSAMKEAGLAFTKNAQKRLAGLMADCLEHGLNVPTVKLAQQVKEDMRQEYLEDLETSDDDAFEAMLGSKGFERAQKLLKNKLKTPGERVSQETKAKLTTGKKTEEPVFTKKDTQKALRDLGYGDSLF